MFRCGPADHAEFVQAVQRALPCGSARDVTTSHDRCVDQIESNSCAALFPVNSSTGEQELSLPADCSGVILTQRVSAPALPAALGQTTSLAH